MNKTAAQAIAKCISIIAQDTAKIAVIDYAYRIEGMNDLTAEVRSNYVKDIERHEQAIVNWLTL